MSRAMAHTHTVRLPKSLRGDSHMASIAPPFNPEIAGHAITDGLSILKID